MESPQSDEEIDEEMLLDENAERAFEGKLALKLKPDRLSKRVDRLNKIELEHIGEYAVSHAEERLRAKKVKVYSERAKFTGYWQHGIEKFYGMKRESSEYLSYNIKGGGHPVIKMALDDTDKRHFMIQHAKIMEYRIRPDGHGGYYVHIPKTNRKRRIVKSYLKR